MTLVAEFPSLNFRAHYHDTVSRTVEVGEQFVLFAQLTLDVVLETSASITDDLHSVARHLASRKLSIILKIVVSHNY